MAGCCGAAAKSSDWEVSFDGKPEPKRFANAGEARIYIGLNAKGRRATMKPVPRKAA